MASNRGFRVSLFAGLASAVIISGALNNSVSAQTPVEQLTQTFGTPEQFATNFENTVKDRSDQIVGLLIAASGFVYVIRVFIH